MFITKETYRSCLCSLDKGMESDTVFHWTLSRCPRWTEKQELLWSSQLSPAPNIGVVWRSCNFPKPSKQRVSVIKAVYILNLNIG